MQESYGLAWFHIETKNSKRNEQKVKIKIKITTKTKQNHSHYCQTKLKYLPNLSQLIIIYCVDNSRIGDILYFNNKRIKNICNPKQLE